MRVIMPMQKTIVSTPTSTAIEFKLGNSGDSWEFFTPAAFTKNAEK
jgi:hypothetical protein